MNRPSTARQRGVSISDAPQQRPSSAHPSSSSAPTAAAAEAASRIQVAVRVRPLLTSNPTADGPKDDVRNVVVEALDRSTVSVDDGRRGRTFAFDHVFGPEASQAQVYGTVGKGMLAEAYKGFNVCLFAYGQTGSGKTFSMQGDVAYDDGDGGDSAADAVPREESPSKPTATANRNNASEDASEADNDAGLIPRFVSQLFAHAQSLVEADSSLTVKITMTFLEVYMEKVRDLLGPRTRGVEAESLEIQEDKARKVTVRGLSVHQVLSVDRVLALLRIGNRNRQSAETKMNELSSRSHSIVQFTVTQLHEDAGRRDVESTISLVDLAGSERQTKSEASGLQFEEAKKINQSLLTLGRAMHAFSEGKSELVSLRESKLTRLLSEAFGGNAKTWMLATVAPSSYNLTESLSTLEYATHAKSIMNRATVNNMARHMELVELRECSSRLEANNETLKAQLQELRDYNAQLERDNAELERLAADAEQMQQETALDGLLKQELEATEKLRSYLRLLRNQGAAADSNGIGDDEKDGSARAASQKRNNSNSAAADDHDVDDGVASAAYSVNGGLFIGHAALDLTSVLLETHRSFSLPLECASSVYSGAVITVDIYPVTQAGVPIDRESSSFDGSPRTSVLDAVGSSVRWEVNVRDVRGLPEVARRTQCRLSFRFDADCSYTTPWVEGGQAPKFDWVKRFHIPNASQPVVEYCAENEVLIFEVVSHA